MAKKQKRVFLALGWYDYRLHQGIEKYAQEHGWHLYADYTREKIIPWGWQGDGILAWLGAGDDLADFVKSAKIPTVDFSYRRPQLKFPRVLEDHAHAAKIVAEHFLGRGFTNFCFYSDANNWSYEERGNGFIKTLGDTGHNCAWLRWLESAAYATGKLEWQRKRKWLATQMRQAPKPLAVFAGNDQQALDVLESCQSVGIKIPEEVAIVGTENYLLAPDAMQTPISSVDTNLEVLGYRGAELLDQLMAGSQPPAEPIRIPAAGVIVRKSSDILTIKHPGVARLLEIVKEREAEGYAGHRDRREQQRADQRPAAEPVAGEPDAGRHAYKETEHHGGETELKAGPDRRAEGCRNLRVPVQRVGMRREQDQLLVEHAEIKGQQQRYADECDANHHHQRNRRVLHPRQRVSHASPSVNFPA